MSPVHSVSSVLSALLLVSVMVGCSPSSPEGESASSHGLQARLQKLTASDCPAGYRVIRGTDAAETLNGTSGNDCILGFGGNDTLNGNGGNDFIAGGNGDDVISGGNGDDQLFGEAGNDNLNGNAGNDNADGGDGDDTCQGSTGLDTLQGGLGRDKLYGGDNDDVLRGGADDDVLHGDAANDRLYGDDGDDVLDGDANVDNLYGGNGDDALYGDTGNDNLYGEAGDDALLGGGGTNLIDGGLGTDACAGTSCEKPALTLTGCTQDAQCGSGQHCITDFGLCLGCVSNRDGDLACDSKDGCPTDAAKVVPGVCGCGVSDVDGDGDGTPNCNDACAADPAKTAPGVCGCGVSDADGDGDGTPNCHDACAADAAKVAPGVCGCGVVDADTDGDGRADCIDLCAGYNDASDADADGTPDGCDVPTDCTANTVGVGVHRGDFSASSQGALAALTGVTCVTGNLTLSGSALSGLQPLSALKNVAGGVTIQATSLTSLAGLEALTTIRAGLTILDNPQLQDITALSNLQWITEWGVPNTSRIANNQQLPACALFALQPLFINGCEQCTGNNGTTTCGDPAPDFACAFGARGPGIYDGSAVLSASEPGAFPLEGAVCVTGDLSITGASDLSMLRRLRKVGGRLSILGTTVTNLNDLSQLQTVGNGIEVRNNDQLRSLTGLSQLSRVDTNATGYDLVAIESNNALPACEAWGLAHQVGQNCWHSLPYRCGGNRGTGSCGDVPPDFACVPGARGPGVFDGSLGWGWDSASDFELGGLTCVTRNLGIDYSAINPAQLTQLQKIGGSLTVVEGRDGLAGLSALREIGGTLSIVASPQLTSLSGLSNLQTLGAGTSAPALRIYGNESLPGCHVWGLAARLGKECTFGRDGNCGLNTGSGSCGTLPEGFVCAAGATGPGVLDLGYAGWTSSSMLAELGGITCLIGDLYLDTDAPETDRAKLGTLSHIGGNLTLSTAAISAFTGLHSVGGAVAIQYAPGVVDLHGLEQLRRVGGDLTIQNNPALRDTSALAHLSSVGGRVQVRDNPVLPACFAWDLVQRAGQSCEHWETRTCTGNAGTGTCGELPAGFVCAPGARGPGVYDGSLYVGYGPAELGGLTCVTGDFTLASLAGVPPSLRDIGGSLFLMNSNLASVDELGSLTRIGGGLVITDNTQLRNVAGLSGLTTIGGDVSIVGNPLVHDLDGLEQVTNVGGGLFVRNNAALTSVAGIDDIDVAGAVSVNNNASLPGCQTFSTNTVLGKRCQSSGWCTGNTGIGNCGALPPGFLCAPGAEGPGVWDGDLRLSSDQQLQDMHGVTCVTGQVLMQYELTDLSVLQALEAVGGSLQVVQTSGLANVDGLGNLKSVAGTVTIDQNARLENLAGLANLERVGPPYVWAGMSITNNPVLPACWAAMFVNNLKPVGVAEEYTRTEVHAHNNTGLGDCGELPPGFRCELGARGPGVLSGSASWEDELQGVKCVTNGVYITQSPWTDLSNLHSVEAIGADLWIWSNPQLTSVDGLEKLKTVGRWVSIGDNPQLDNLRGLSGLTQIGDGGAPDANDGTSLDIRMNPSLPECWAQRIAQQTGVPYVPADPDGGVDAGNCPP